MAIYRAFAETGRRPELAALTRAAGSLEKAREALAALAKDHIVVLDDDDPDLVEMAIPFSGVPGPHRVRVGAIDSWENCAWDTFGIIAALANDRSEPMAGTISSRCADCNDDIELEVRDGQVDGDALVHFVVPARHWWDDIRFT